MAAMNLPMRIWLETGGDTGGGEIYHSGAADVARLDWDDWHEWMDHPETYDATFLDGTTIHEWVADKLRRFGDVMPASTRATLSNFMLDTIVGLEHAVTQQGGMR